MNTRITIGDAVQSLKTILVYGYTLHYHDGKFVISVPGGADETYSEGTTLIECIKEHNSPEKRKWRRDHG